MVDWLIFLGEADQIHVVPQLSTQNIWRSFQGKSLNLLNLQDIEKYAKMEIMFIMTTVSTTRFNQPRLKLKDKSWFFFASENKFTSFALIIYRWFALIINDGWFVWLFNDWLWWILINDLLLLFTTVCSHYI